MLPTSLGTKSGTFSQAFASAHAQGGPGHTFSWNGNVYTTNRADGRDMRSVPDGRDETNHWFRSKCHGINAAVKRATNDVVFLEWVRG